MTTLNIGRQGGHERPHKPALLLAIISLAEQGLLTTNCLQYSPDLFTLFGKYFRAVRTSQDSLNMLDPFWRLRSDGLLSPIPVAGFEGIAASAAPPSVSQLREATVGSAFPDGLFEALQDPTQRSLLREALIDRYFAMHRQALMAIAQEECQIGEYEQQIKSGVATPTSTFDPPVREQAFRRVVLRAYDYRCAACGLRVILDDLVLVDAAHLVPWCEGHDDDPRNGVALCKNHHWAMDRALIAPTAGRFWKVSPMLDDRIEGQRDLLELESRRMLLPLEVRFHPKHEALAWRAERLLGSSR